VVQSRLDPEPDADDHNGQHTPDGQLQGDGNTALQQIEDRFAAGPREAQIAAQNAANSLFSHRIDPADQPVPVLHGQGIIQAIAPDNILNCPFRFGKSRM
jgi:hypothetical protein